MTPIDARRLWALADDDSLSYEQALEISRRQEELRDDCATVRSYGEEHPGDWTGLMFEGVTLVAGFCANKERHEARLQGLVTRPDRLVVRSVRFSARYLEACRAEIEQLLLWLPDRPLQTLGVRFDVISVQLEAWAETWAGILAERYGTAVELTLGAHAYPRDRTEPFQPVIPPPPEIAIFKGLAIDLELQSARLQSGHHGEGRVVLRNTGTDAVVFHTHQPLTASVIDPSTGETVGAYVGPIAGTGRIVDLAPGQLTTIHVWVGTASLKRSLGYALPAGRHWVRVRVPVYGPEPGRKRALYSSDAILDIDSA